MNINIETKFNINDEVYFIIESKCNHDFYCTDTVWRVFKYDSNSRKFEPFKIKDISINQYINEVKIYYNIEDFYYPEEDIFFNLEDAEKECEVRNTEIY